MVTSPMMGSGYRQSTGKQYGKNRKRTNGEHVHREPQALLPSAGAERMWRGAVENEVVGWAGGSSKGEAIPSLGRYSR